MKVTRATHPEIVRLLLSVYPHYRGRKFQVDFRENVHIHDYWDGGSRTYACFVELATGRHVSSDALPNELRQKQGNWFNLPIADGKLVSGIALAEHSIFCGKDVGLRLILHPSDAPRALPTGEIAK